jgi:hypothetical protein
MPWTLLRAAGLFSPMMREIVKMSYLWRTPHSLDGGKLEQAVGKFPATSPVAAIRQAIADLSLDDKMRRLRLRIKGQSEGRNEDARRSNDRTG